MLLATDTPNDNDATVGALKAALKGLNSFEWVARSAEHVLKGARATRQYPLTGAEVFKKVGDIGLEFPVSEATFSQYLSGVAKQLESPVTSTGRGRGGGYYLSDVGLAAEYDAAVDAETSASRDWGKEKYLYPSLVAWMVGQGYRAEDTSSIRSLGKWGNPDVTGMNVHCLLSQREVEVVTIEAKLGLESWEIDFFQAVSQRRFANRSYFAFALPEALSDKLPRELRYYSEKFAVGVLVIDFEDDLYDRLLAGKINDNDREFLNDSDGRSVREVLTAPWSHVPIRYQSDVCKALNIVDEESLYSWGVVP